MKGLHVFYATKKDGPYESINYLVQIASIKYWKKHHGDITLYCNNEFLKRIKLWGINKLYDHINTECLENLPDIGGAKCEITGLPKYWSFPKMVAIKDFSKNNDKFVTLDTDLWIQRPFKIDESCHLVGYHREKITGFRMNPYISPDNFLNNEDLKGYNWNIAPFNCAIIYLNSKELIHNWYEMALKVIETGKSIQVKRETSSDTIFIEQRLLPTIAAQMNLKMDVILPNVYIPENKKDGTEFEPPCGYTDENKILCKGIKHVWGIKSLYNNIHMRKLILNNLSASLLVDFPETKVQFNKLLLNIFKTCL
jgi:hypothetical protein